MNCVREVLEDNKNIFRTIFRTITMSVFVFLLASLIAVTPASAACSNASLKGVFGY